MKRVIVKSSPAPINTFEPGGALPSFPIRENSLASVSVIAEFLYSDAPRD
jgi:hypothetical protein